MAAIRSVGEREEKDSSRAQGELDADRVEREGHSASFCPFQEAGIDQCVHVAVDSFHIAFDPSCDLTDGEWPLTGHGLEHFPALGREHFPEQFGCGEADSRSLFLAPECLKCSTRCFFTGSDLQDDSSSSSLSPCVLICPEIGQ